MLRSETAGDPARTERALAGLSAYQQAPRRKPPRPLLPVAEIRGSALRSYARPGARGQVVLFVPSLINPPDIFDLDRERSLLRWLAGGELRPLLLDWGPAELRRHLSVAGHVETILLPLIAALDEPPVLVGYCLGGTMAAAAAQLAAVRGLATIAAPWHFSGFPDGSRAALAALWAQAAPAAQAMGRLPMEVLQAAFWQLDPARTIGKYEAFAGFDPDSPEAAAFVTLEDWTNQGEPIPLPAARELFEDMFAADLPGKGAWQVGGQIIDPAGITAPMLHFVSASDRIVPAASAFESGDRVMLAPGHVGMVIGSSARRQLWEPLARWLANPAPG